MGEAPTPIARWENDVDGEVLLMDLPALLIHVRPMQLSDRTVRRRCEAIACDVVTRAPLYDEQGAAAQLATVRARPGPAGDGRLAGVLQLAT